MGGIGAYRDDNAKPWVLPVVKQADDLLRKDPELNHEYLPIAGLQDFTSASQQLVLGKSLPAVQEKRAVSLQSVSGTGALHLGSGFLARFYNPSNPEAKTIYVSSPTWANHNQVFGNSKVPVKTYPYFHKETKGLDFDGMLSKARRLGRQLLRRARFRAHDRPILREELRPVRRACGLLPLRRGPLTQRPRRSNQSR